MPKNSLQSMESTSNQEFDNYVAAVSDVLQAYYAHSLRNLPDNFTMILGNWTALLMKCGIPANQLMDIYLEAHANMPKGDYFNIDTIIATWNEMREQRLYAERAKEVCSVCKGKKRTGKYDMKLQKNIVVDCPKCI